MGQLLLQIFGAYVSIVALTLVIGIVRDMKLKLPTSESDIDRLAFVALVWPAALAVFLYEFLKEKLVEAINKTKGYSE